MNHERVKIFRDKLDNFTMSDYHGLKSPGLTCYLNSVLQVLFMTEGFREEIQSCCSEDSTTIDRDLKRLFDDLGRKKARTHSITETLGITDLYKQRDAAEYFENILRLTSPDASKIFQGELLHKTKCLQCEKGNDSRSSFWILPLVVKDSHHQTYSVEQGFKAFFQGEKVGEENMMFCNHCKEKQEAEIDCEITQNPANLALLLKRFSFDNKRKRYLKLHCKVDVPETLCVKSCTYDLYALVDHFGEITGGHYTAQIKSFETRGWYHFNDDVVSMVKQPLFGPGNTSVKSRTAYLLMYRKVSTHSVGDQETDAAFDVKAEGRHGETQRREDLVPHQQLKDECCNKEENLKYFNGDLLIGDVNDAANGKNQRNSSVEWDKPLNQTVAHQRPHKEMLFHINTGTGEDSFKRPLQQKSKCSKLEIDEGRQQPDTNSKVHVCCAKTGGSPTAHEDSCYEQKLNSPEVKGKTWEKPDRTEPWTRTQTSSSSARKRVNPAEMRSVKNKKDAVAEISVGRTSIKQRTDAGVSVSVGNSSVKSGPVLSNGHSPPSPSYTRRSHSQSRVNEKANNLHRNRNNKTQHPVTGDSSKLEVTKNNAKTEPCR